MSNRLRETPPPPRSAQLRLALLPAFEAAARTLSFTPAAQELFLTQSAISRQIQQLEAALGTALFERRHRALALTEAGRVMQRAVNDSLERLRDAATAVRASSGPRQVAITCTPGLRVAVADPAPHAIHRGPPTGRCAHLGHAGSAGPCPQRHRRGRAVRPEQHGAGPGAVRGRSAAPVCAAVAEGRSPLEESGRPCASHFAGSRHAVWGSADRGLGAVVPGDGPARRAHGQHLEVHAVRGCRGRGRGRAGCGDRQAAPAQ